MIDQFQVKSVISHVTTTLLPEAVLKHSFFINDVSPELQLNSNETEITAAIKKLLLEELLQSTNACIRISAAVQNNQLQLTVHKKGPFALPLIQPN